MTIWERPSIRLLAIFLILGMFAWWTFRTVSLPPLLRDLFEEDKAIASAAIPATPEEKIQQEFRNLPPPPENHAPEVAALLERLTKLPPVPYIVQAARQRDAAIRQGEVTPPWSPEELAAEAECTAAFLSAWQPFLDGPPVAWEQYPDSARLFRSSLFQLLEEPGGRKLYAEIFFLPGFQLLKKLQSLGTLRFGSFSSWSVTDTAKLSEILADQNLTFQGTDDELRTLRATYPAPPTIVQIREGLRVDRALFLSAARYLESLPKSTSAEAGLTAFLGDAGDASWFVGRLPARVGEASSLASFLRRGSDQIRDLEQKTFLTRQAWNQWLAGNPSQGLLPFLADSLDGMREFETSRLLHQLTVSFLDAALAFRERGPEAARQVPDPARPGSFFQVEETEDGVRFTSAFVPLGKTNAVSFQMPAPGEKSP